MDRTYDDYKELINQHLMDFIPVIDNKSISLYDSMKYSLTAGGKRLRPVLVQSNTSIPIRLSTTIFPPWITMT